MNTPFLTMTGIGKTYPGVQAVADLNFSVAAGEVVGLVGENGAGKSTLMKILGGVIAPTAGTITLDGVEMERLSVTASMRGGIAFVHQELNLFDNLSTAANIFIGREPLRSGFLKLIDTPQLNRMARPLLEQLGADFQPDTPVGELSLAQKQLVEIAKALSHKARLVIMDEPTSSLTAAETERLLRIIAQLKTEGVAVILITHRLAEVEHAADRVVVLRDGRLVTELGKDQIRAETMVRAMIGRDLKTLYRPPALPVGAPMLELENVRTVYRPEQSVSLAVHSGEILGLAGLVGSGRSELACTIFGLTPLAGGLIRMAGEIAKISTPKDAIERGIYLIPEDRKKCGLVLDFPVVSNITLPNLPASSRRGLTVSVAEAQCATRQQRDLDIRAASLKVAAGSLSGGNQQKVVLAKWLAMSPNLLIFDEPTRGVDVGAKNEIYRLMRDLADKGAGILMISSDMEEVIGVSDRVAVMHEGRISGFLDRESLSEQAIMSLAIGRVSA